MPDQNAGGTGNNQQQQPPAGNNQQQQQQPPADFESWIGQQPGEIKTAYDGHVRGLRTALESERNSRKDLEKQLRDLAGKAEKGSEAERQLTELTNKITDADRRAAFYETASAAGVKNLRLAYTVALQDDLFNKRGEVDLEALKKTYPELFAQKSTLPAGNAGSGLNGGTPRSTMNDWIREKAGRG